MDFLKKLFTLILILSFTFFVYQSWVDFKKENGHNRTDTFKDYLSDGLDFENWDQNAKINIYEDVTLKIGLTQKWKFSIGDDPSWASPSFEDSRWEEIKVPAAWEDDGYNGYDGYAWYRVLFDGSNLKQNQIHYLILGFVDDVDEAYINGNMVGLSGSFPPRYKTAYNSNRKYFFNNQNINFEGDNLIAVRVYDQQLNGGILSGNPGIYASKKPIEIKQPLNGIWKFDDSDNTSYSQIDFDDSGWKDLLIPSFWDNQGYRSLDGLAWYRKSFNLDFNIQHGETYYLVLGKIDDFDVTYLNGQKIGETNDGKDAGNSESYLEIRAYKIPTELLRKEGNVIAVKVNDLWLEGGIYEGPIGIVEEADLSDILENQEAERENF